MLNVAYPNFSSRLSYACLVYAFRASKWPSDAEIARAAGRTGEWLAKWKGASVPPRDDLVPGEQGVLRSGVHEPIARFLGAEERWLFRGEGEPPEPWLWERWVSVHYDNGRRPVYERLAEQHGRGVTRGTPATPPRPRKRGRGRS